jgi:copper chaperone
MHTSNSVLSYSVPAMSCGHCVSAISEEVRGVEGVVSVTIDLETKVVRVAGNDLSDQAIRASIAEAGFEASP